MNLRNDLWKTLLHARVTLLLVVINVVAFFIPAYFDTRFLDSLAQTSFLIDWGGNISALTYSGEYWRLLSSQFLHAGRIHLLMNMLALWSIGSVLEARLPRLVYLTIYLLSGIAGGLASAIYNSDSLIVSCGASGAILGLAGALLAHVIVVPGDKGVPIKSLLVSLGLTFAAGAFASVDNMAHGGGLAFGLIFGALIVFIIHVWQPGYMMRSIIFCGLSGCSLAAAVAVYTIFSIPGGHAQVTAVKVLDILENVGFGDIGAEMTGMTTLDKCVETQINNASPDLKACSKVEFNQYIDNLWIQRRLQHDFTQCLLLVAELTKAYSDETDRQKLAVVKDFCESREQLYMEIFSTGKVSVDVAKLQETERRMHNLADDLRLLSKRTFTLQRSLLDYLSSSQDEGSEEDPDDIKSQGVFNDVTSRIYKTVQLARCPYYYCTKP